MKINLPKPCHEDWNKMTQEDKGRFCGSCQKIVVDFSVMSDKEIVNYFKEYKGNNTCGHFKKNQIDRTLKQGTPRRTFFLKELATACVAFFLASTEAKAQIGDIPLTEKQTEQNNLESDEGKIVINGKVKNGNELLANATISIKDTKQKTQSLENGSFSISIPKEITQNNEVVTLVIEYEGLESREIEIKPSITHQFYEIDFAENTPLTDALAGQTDGVQIIHSKRTITGKVTSSDGALPAATVQIKGTTIGTTTDMEGNYTLENVPNDAVLVYRFVGLNSKEETIASRNTINVQLEDALLGETFVVGGISSKPYKWYSPRNLWYKIRNIFR
ncbi:carboxypeptidase-like regulatory domain-containing protein [Bernardetia sp.]|uniref:carboxypeptidase-like regulatory domain-containing protein n=1 Tax=Bernardetia sp. TaxID=1937974 RepID=UPI0025C0AB39|nr:carboxypeptidase-like regulatory domain-containing protein [Bernardetia sp.]